MNIRRSTLVSTVATVLLALPAGAQGPATQPTAPPPAPAAAAPVAESISVIREGTFLVDRTGRLRHAPDGQQWQFHLDPSPTAQAAEPPVLILPNLNLMLMENAVTANARDVRFKITGMVTEFHGRNHVLLQKVVVVPDLGKLPARN